MATGILAEADVLYAALPRARRSDLYDMVKADPTLPAAFASFLDDDDSLQFRIATGNYTAPAARDRLWRILKSVFDKENYDIDIQNRIVQVYLDKLREIAAAPPPPLTKGGTSYKRYKQQTISHKKLRGHRKTQRGKNKRMRLKRK
jgi:hypothetical protein